MIEILWHGRGGQGAFTAARLLGAAGSSVEGTYGLAFPSFGPERRGAPMRAFTKFDDKPVGDRSAIAKADYVVYLDETLFAKGWESELKSGGKVLVNSAATFQDPRVTALDASGIAKRILKRDIPNTVFLAALCELVDGLTAEAAKSAIRDYMPAKLHAANIQIVDEVVELLQGASAQGTDACPKGEDASSQAEAAPSIPEHEPPARIIPTLRTEALDPAVYARTTCWEGGYLVSKNAGWRTMRPVIDEEACIGCLQCYMHCPDGTIFKAAPKLVAVDYDFCKGCGICVKTCPRDAIRMIPEGGEE